MHAMVLDTVQKITETEQGYEAGDYKLIFKNTYDDEDNGKPKKFTINANHQQAPDVFYYVHIDVDLDRVYAYDPDFPSLNLWTSDGLSNWDDYEESETETDSCCTIFPKSLLRLGKNRVDPGN